MAFLRKVKAGLVKFPVDQYIGEYGHLFYNQDTGQLYLSDGQTVGGIPITGGANDTDQLPEGSTNLYYTQARVFDDIDQKVTAAFVSGLMSDADTLDGFDSSYFATAASVTALTNTVNDLTTDDVDEGSGNLYFTYQRAIDAIGGEIDDAGTTTNDLWSADQIITYVDGQLGTGGAGIQTTSGAADADKIIRSNSNGYLDASFLIGRDTGDLSEGTNLYYTDARVNARIDTRVTKGFVDALNVDADTLDGNDSTFFATASDLSNLESEVDSLDTDDIPEGVNNFYYTVSRFNSAFGNRTTDDLSEGTSNLYYTDTRANSAIDARVTKGFVDALNVDADTLDGNDSTFFASQTTVDNLTTDDIAEGSNLYFTNARAIAAIGGDINDAGSAANDLWSADRILTEFTNQIGTGGSVGVQTTIGSADADKLIRTDAAGYLDASFLIGRDSDDLSEGATNLYYSTTRFNADFANRTTNNLTEGGTNLYFTDARAISAVGGELDDFGLGPTDLWSANKITTYIEGLVEEGGSAGIDVTSGVADAEKLIRTDGTGYLHPTFLDGLDTDDLSEGTTNLYYTVAKANSAIDARVTKSFVDALNVDADTLDGNDSTFFATATGLTNLTNTVNNLDTDDIPEGSTNLYYTDARADARVTAILANFRPENKIYVDKSPLGEGEFLTIAEALDEITNRGGASLANPYVISVGPGVFEEDPFEIPPYVALIGSGRNTIMEASDTSQNFVTVGADSWITQIGIRGPGDPGTYSIALNDTRAGDVLVTFVEFYGSWGFLSMVNTTAHLINVRIEDITVNSKRQAVRPALISTTSSGVLDVGISRFFHNITEPLISINHYFDILGPATVCVLNDVRVSGGPAEINHAFHVENGSTVVLNSVGFSGVNVGLHVDNVGAGPFIRLSSVTFNSNTWDVLVENPSTTGSISGSIADDKISIVDGSNLIIDALSTIGTNTGKLIVGEIFQGDTVARSLNLTKLIREASTMGRIEGGEISTISATNEITVSAGSGFLINTSDDVVIEVFWEETDLTIANGQERWIVVNSDSNVLAVSSPPGNFTNFILLGRVFAEDNEIRFIENISTDANHISNRDTAFFRDALGPVYATGSTVSESSTPLQLDVGSGRYYYGSTPYTPSGGNDISFTEVYQDGLGGFTTVNDEQIVPVQYDDGTGTLATPTAGYYVKHSLYLVGDNGQEYYYLVIGQDEYDNLSVAEQSALPNPPTYIRESFVLIASIVVQEGQSNIIEILDERPVIGFKAAGVSASTTHGNLLGLGSDDHPQYLRTDGTRALEGDMSLGNHELTNVQAINGVAIEAHAGRHLPNGADPLATGTPSTIGTTNQEGIQNALARQDHIHAHGDQAGGSLHALATQSVAGFLSAADKTLLDALSVLDTDGVPEGSTNLYYTDERVDDRVSNLLIAGDDIDLTYDDSGGTLTVDVVSSTTSVADTVVKRDANKSFGIGSIQFDTVDPASHSEGLLHWDTVSGGLEVDMAGGEVKLQVGQELLTRVFNDTGQTILNGTVVIISGTSVNGIVVDLAIATPSVTYDGILGITTEDIADQSLGFVASYGTVRGLNTSSFNTGDQLFLSADTAGGLTSTRPVAPNKEIFVGTVAASDTTTGAILISPQINKRLDSLSDVLISDIQTGEIIQWDTDRFVNVDGFSTFASLTSFNALESTVNTLNTDDVDEGSANLYFTFARAIDAVGGEINDAGTGTTDLWSANQIISYIDLSGIQSTTGVSDADKLIRTDAAGYLDASFLIGRDTDDLSEGSNLYYTQARFDTAFGNKSTDDLTEGSNLYFTNARAISAIGGDINDGGMAADDLWSADRIISYIDGRVGTGGAVGIQSTSGVSDADKLIRTDSDGYLGASFLNGRSTSDLSEGSNLYYTQARFDTAFNNKDTDDLGEGVTNLYFTQSRAISAIGGQIDDAGTATNDIWSADQIISYIDGRVGTGGTIGVQATTGASDADKLIRTDAFGYLDASFLTNIDTDDISEGTTNLYFTDARAIAAIGGDINDAGTATDDLWSADRIIDYVGNQTVGDHGNLTGLADNDHPQYLLRDGTNVMTGALNLDSNNIINAGTINGVTITAHASRHLPNGSDALATAAPSTTLGATTSNTEGTANSFARSDHVHDVATAAPVTQGPDNANSEGTSNNLARADHVHNIPAATAVNTSNNTNAEGSSTSFARADHTHQLSNNTPSTNNIMQWDGSNWIAVSTFSAYAEAESEQSTTSTTFITGLTTTINIPVTGNYEVTWFVEARNSNKDRDTVIRVQIDDATTLTEVSHGRQNDQLTNTYYQVGGFRRLNISAGSHTFDLDYRAGDNTAFIRRARIQITRIL